MPNSQQEKKPLDEKAEQLLNDLLSLCPEYVGEKQAAKNELKFYLAPYWPTTSS